MRMKKYYFKNRKKCALLLSLFILSYFTASSITKNTWNNSSGDGKWSTAGNWSLSHVPTTTECAYFDNTSVSNCTMDYASYGGGAGAYLGQLYMAAAYTGTITYNSANKWYIGGTAATGPFGTTSPVYILGGTLDAAASTNTFQSCSSIWINGGIFNCSTTAATQLFGDSVMIQSGTINVNGSGILKCGFAHTTGNNGVFSYTGGTFTTSSSSTIILFTRANNTAGYNLVDVQGNALNFTGNLQIQTSSVAGISQAIQFNGQSVTVAGNLNFAASTSTNTVAVNASSATTITVNGNLTSTGGTTINHLDINNPVNIAVKGNIALTGITALSSAGTGTISCTGGAAQSITNSGLPFPTLLIDKTLGTSATLGANITYGALNLNVSSGNLDLSTFTINRASAGGTLTTGSNGTIICSGTSGGFGIGSNYPSNYSTNTHNGTVKFANSSGTQYIPSQATGLTLNNIICATSGTGTLSIYNTTSLTGDLTIQAGSVFDLSTFTFNRNATGGTLTIASTGTLNVGGTSGGFSGTVSNFPANFDIYTLDATSTVNFNQPSNASQSIPNSAGIPSVSYGNLKLTSASSSTKSLTGNTTIKGSLTISSTCILDVTAGNYTISIAGNWTNNGTFTPRAGLVNFNGSTNSQTIIGATTFNDLLFSNTSVTPPQISLANNVSVNNNLAFNNSPLVNLNNLTLTLGSSAASAGSLTHTGLSSNGWMYGGTFKRYYVTSQVSVPSSAGLFPLGTSAAQTNDYCPMWIGSTANLTTGGSVSVTFNWASNNTFFTFYDASWGVNVDAVTNSNWVIAGTIVPSGNNLRIRYGGGTPTFGTNNLDSIDACLSTSALGVWAAATAVNIATEVNRTGLSVADLNNEWHIGSSDLDQASLPVTWLKFAPLYEKGNSVIVNWSTATQIDNHYFSVQRSRDGTVFEEVYREYSIGNILVTKNYSFTDEVPEKGLWYYQVVQVDLNGKSSSTGIKTVMVKPVNIIFYPNPVYDRIVFANVESVNGKMKIEIFETSGKLVKEFDFSDMKTSEFELYISDISRGSYILKLSNPDDNKIYCRKSFIKI